MNKLAIRTAGVGAAVALAVVGVFFATGGSVLTTSGISMEPALRAGDLAVLRPAADYSIGDVAAYDSDKLRTVVLHRIIETNDGEYTFQGDSNSWVDPEQPTQSDLKGKLIARVPRGGVWLDRATTPTATGIAAFLLLTGGGAAAENQRRRRRRGRLQQPAVIAKQTRPGLRLTPRLRQVAVATAAVAAAGAALGAVAWSTPVVATATMQRPTGAKMVFEYHADVSPSAAYDDTTVTSPAPVFRKLTNTVDVSFAYEGPPGKVSVEAEISAANGWKSTVPLAATRTFTDERYADTVSVDLDAIEARTVAASKATGMPIEQVTVAIVPTIHMHSGGTFAPALNLNVTPLQMTMAGLPEDLTVTDSAVMTRTQRTVNMIGAGGVAVPAKAARTAAIALLLAACIAAIWTAAAVVRSTRRARDDEAADIRKRHGSLLVAVEPVTAPPGRPVVDVAEIGTLVRIAERYGLLILHWSRSNVETFVVQDDSTTYRYRTGAAGRTAEPSDATPPALTGGPSS